MWGRGSVYPLILNPGANWRTISHLCRYAAGASRAIGCWVARCGEQREHYPFRDSPPLPGRSARGRVTIIASETPAGFGDSRTTTCAGAQCFGLVNTGHRVTSHLTTEQAGAAVMFYMRLGGAGIESHPVVLLTRSMKIIVEYPDPTKTSSLQILSDEPFTRHPILSAVYPWIKTAVCSKPRWSIWQKWPLPSPVTYTVTSLTVGN